MHITKTSRDTYQFTSDFFHPDGRVTFDSFSAARKFASQMTAHRSQPVPASDLYALSLIDEAMRVLVKHFAPSAVLSEAVKSVNENVGSKKLELTEKKFVSEYPPENVYRGEEKVEEYLSKLTNGRVKTIEELIYVFTHNVNPAISPLLDLVDVEPLERTIVAFLRLLCHFFEAAIDISRLEAIFVDLATHGLLHHVSHAWRCTGNFHFEYFQRDAVLAGLRLHSGSLRARGCLFHVDQIATSSSAICISTRVNAR